MQGKTLFPMFKPSADLWAPQERGLMQAIAEIEKGKDVIIQGPTGSGKTRLASELFRYAETMKWGAIFYVNRKLLVGQTSDSFNARGIKHGVRAADYEDRYDFGNRNQIASIVTEMHRVWIHEIWNTHPAKLIIVDEAHIQKSKTLRQTIDRYKEEHNAVVVLLSATPVNMLEWADSLVITGKLSEYRACKSIVVAECKCISQMDMRKVKRSAKGEYVLDGEAKKRFVQTIVGDVIDRWKKYNPDGRATMLYAPGVPESRYFVKQFEEIGVRFAHVDADSARIDGEDHRLTRGLWQDIMGEFEEGKIRGISSRFKLREGVDAPWAYHCILATPIGSLASYIQTVGRVLRYSKETPDRVLVTDHGGNVWRHGSPNHDCDWKSLWKMSDYAASNQHLDLVKEAVRPESIVCPECETERQFGDTCPSCGFKHAKSMRKVMVENGRFKTIEGPMVAQKKRKDRSSEDAKRWAGIFWGARKSKSNRATSFRQLEQRFFRKFEYYPDRNLPFMPINQDDFGENAKTIPFDKLIGKEQS